MTMFAFNRSTMSGSSACYESACAFSARENHANANNMALLLTVDNAFALSIFAVVALVLSVLLSLSAIIISLLSIISVLALIIIALLINEKRPLLALRCYLKA